MQLQSMSDSDLVTFADAMQWDSSDELEVLEIKQKNWLILTQYSLMI
jgi:hypothetical protein